MDAKMLQHSGQTIFIYKRHFSRTLEKPSRSTSDKADSLSNQQKNNLQQQAVLQKH